MGEPVLLQAASRWRVCEQDRDRATFCPSPDEMFSMASQLLLTPTETLWQLIVLTGTFTLVLLPQNSPLS